MVGLRFGFVLRHNDKSSIMEFIDSVSGTLDLSVNQGPEQDFARDMLDRIDKGWSALLRFTERFYTKLTAVANVSGENSLAASGTMLGSGKKNGNIDEDAQKKIYCARIGGIVDVGICGEKGGRHKAGL
jgi:hypothetical protein